MDSACLRHIVSSETGVTTNFIPSKIDQLSKFLGMLQIRSLFQHFTCVQGYQFAIPNGRPEPRTFFDLCSVTFGVYFSPIFSDVCYHSEGRGLKQDEKRFVLQLKVKLPPRLSTRLIMKSNCKN